MIPLIIVAALVFLAVTVFSKPIRVALKLVFNVAFGFAALVIINFIGADIGISLGVTWQNAIVTGLLGIPGVALLLVLDYFSVI